MRRADFILRHTEPILAQWEAFAGSPVPVGAICNLRRYTTMRRRCCTPLPKTWGLRKPWKPNTINQ